MSHIKPPLNQIPIACTLDTIAGARTQVEKWQAFNADYALSSELTDTDLIICYDKLPNLIRRLRELVVVERRCCAFVEWSIDEDHDGVRLIAHGTPAGLAALNVH